MNVASCVFQDRKAVLKSFKTFVLKIAREEYGHMVLLVAFDVIDDVKIVEKILLQVSDVTGRHLVSPGNRK